ncbi:MAG: hypothetical protein ACK502_05950 [Alphaproteobacteria bacterium]
MDKPTETPKHRGTIIVDSNALFDLRVAVNQDFIQDNDKKKRYFEILRALGKQGFSILIPEEAVFETTRHVVMEDGKTLKSAMPYLTPPHDGFVGDMGLVPVFRQILEDKVSGVHILSSLQLLECPATVKLRTIRKIMQKHPEPDATSKRAIAPHMDKLHNLSDKVLAKHLNRFATMPAQDGNIYLLSTDRHFEHAMESAHENHPNIKLLDTTGFMRALTESGVIEMVGIKPSVPFQSMKLDIITNRKDLHSDRHQHIPNGYVDSSCASGDTHHRFLNDQPFAAAMRELARDLGIHAQNGTVGRNGRALLPHTSRLEGRAGNSVHISPRTDGPMQF